MDVDAAWDIVEQVLSDRVPTVAATLRGPAASEDIERLSARVGRDLPADFVASLRRHDGQDNPTRLLDLFDHFTLLGVEDMIATSDMRAEVFVGEEETPIDWMVPDKVRTVMNRRGWLQFTDAEGRGYALDLPADRRPHTRARLPLLHSLVLRNRGEVRRRRLQRRGRRQHLARPRRLTSGPISMRKRTDLGAEAGLSRRWRTWCGTAERSRRHTGRGHLCRGRAACTRSPLPRSG